jgi:FkbM family methyltransferase
MLYSLHNLVNEYAMNINGVLHVGAHTGEEAADYHQNGCGDVLWVEANPEVIPELTEHIAPYPQQRAVCACVDYMSGRTTPFNVTNNVMSSSMFPFGTHADRAPLCVFTHTLKLETISVDDLCEREGFHNWNFLNMDIQGAELFAVMGAETALRHVEWIFTEVNFDELYKGCARTWQLDKYLWDAGFYRAETWMAQGDVGWGDALYVRRDYVR